MGSILRPTKIAKKSQKLQIFFNLCDAITDVIFFMCIDAILGCDIFEKKRSIRSDFDCDAIAIPGINTQIKPERVRVHLYYLQA